MRPFTQRPATSRGGAVVTGAGQGLGREIALGLARNGFIVHVTDVNAERASAVVDEITLRQTTPGGAPCRAFASTLDVRDAAACSAVAIDTAKRAGTLELWVNNAGVLFTGAVWQNTAEQRQLMLEVNAHGTINGSLAALEIMRREESGHIVNIASLAGLVGVPGEGIYAATKHAVLGFSISALGDLRSAGIHRVHISCVCPDGMWTPMLYDKLEDPRAALSFSGVLLQPSDVARQVLGLVHKPRPVTALPGWRGAQVRLLDLLPSLSVRLAPVIVRFSKHQQAAIAKRLRRTGAIETPHDEL